MPRYIDADALKQGVGSYSPVQYTYEYGLVITVEDIDSAPTADVVERKMGKWLDDGLDGIGAMGIEYRWQKCSCCGNSISKAPMQRFQNFCSNCGADMRGERE